MLAVTFWNFQFELPVRRVLRTLTMQYNSNETLRAFDYGAMFLLASIFRTQEASDEEERFACESHRPKSKTTAERLINFRMAKTKTKRNRGAPRNRGANYTTDELTDLAIAVLEILPQNSEEWILVKEMHAQKYPDHQRDEMSIKRQFMKMHRKKQPTGDPHMPEHIRLAKKAFYEIGSRASISDGTIWRKKKYIVHKVIVLPTIIEGNLFTPILRYRHP